MQHQPHSAQSCLQGSRGLLDLGNKVDPGAVGVGQGGPVGSDGAGVLHQGEGYAGGVGGGGLHRLQVWAEDVCACCH